MTTSDWLAVIFIGGGSSYGRDADKEKAIQTAIRSFKDWHQLFEVSNVELTINVVDVSGYGKLDWGSYPDGWLHGVNEATGKDEIIHREVERIKRRTPKWRKRA